MVNWQNGFCAFGFLSCICLHEPLLVHHVAESGSRLRRSPDRHWKPLLCAMANALPIFPHSNQVCDREIRPGGSACYRHYGLLPIIEVRSRFGPANDESHTECKLSKTRWVKAAQKCLATQSGLQRGNVSRICWVDDGFSWSCHRHRGINILLGQRFPWKCSVTLCIGWFSVGGIQTLGQAGGFENAFEFSRPKISQ